MGFLTEFNWGLKIAGVGEIDERNLEVGKLYGFKKDGFRTYPVDVPIDLLNREWVPVAKVIVVELTTANDNTKGKYKVLKIYSGKEKEVLTDYWHENVEIVKRRKIKDFSSVKLS